MLLPVRRNAGDPLLEDLPGRRVENVLTVYGDLTAVAFFKARQDLHQFRLSVSVNAGQTYDLTAAHRKVKSF